MSVRRFSWRLALSASLLSSGAAAAAPATGTDSLPPWLADRGTGMWTSIFGTYVNAHELLFMPFVEGYYDNNTEYKPAELGFGLEQDFRGKFRAIENQIFLAYGLDDAFGVELEAALYTAARLDKAPEDPSSMPARLEQSGFGDWQMELNWRAIRETAAHPEVFALLEVDPPSSVSKPLIGTPDWEAKLAVGAIRGLPWGTVSGRLGTVYSAEDGSFDTGEWAVEYLKRVSPAWSLYGGVEGEQDEIELIGETQWHFSPNATLRLNLAYGLSDKATDWGPDVGVVFRFPRPNR
jgi:hypothetical protein